LEHPLVKFNIAVKKKSEIGSVVKYRIKTPVEIQLHLKIGDEIKMYGE